MASIDNEARASGIVVASDMADDFTDRSAADEQTPDIYHGGDLDAARQLFPDAPAEWIDLSTGINPVPYPIGEISPDAWARLPENRAIASLEAAAASAYGVRDPRCVVAAPGTQSLIQWLTHIAPARAVSILGMTYGEHERVWRHAGAIVSIHESVSDLAAADVAVVVNPNNPDGRLIPTEALLDLGTKLARHSGVLIVDEAFVDVLGPEASLAPLLPRRGFVILRSFGKAYGLAGLRLGFALATPELTSRLRRSLGPWAVCGPAVELGRRALEDRAWLTNAVARLTCEAARLDALLRSVGFEIIGGTPLFRLARHDQTARLFQCLGEAGILARPFPARPDWVRFGIPHLERDWERLQRALRAPVVDFVGSF